MNLAKLFEVQKAFKDRLGYDKVDKQTKSLLAFIVELGECANEHRGFKFWSKNQNPRTKTARAPYMDIEDADFYNPLLEEFVDGLHFVLEIGLEEFEEYGEKLPVNITLNNLTPIKYETIAKQFNYLYNTVGYFMDCVMDCEFGTAGEVGEQYQFVLRMYLGLGEMLGFTWEQIEQAYFDKNKINHVRQATGY